MEFKELGFRERKLLLKALDVDTEVLKCHYCGDRTSIHKCCIMPSLKGKGHTWILCDSILCLSEYIDGVE
jgi:hypothetical protein